MSKPGRRAGGRCVTMNAIVMAPAAGAAGLHVNARRTMAGFAAGVAGLGWRKGESAVSGAAEVRSLFLVALDALLGADERGSGNLRRSDDGAIHHDARDEHESPHCGAAEEQGVF